MYSWVSLWYCILDLAAHVGWLTALCSGVCVGVSDQGRGFFLKKLLCQCSSLLKGRSGHSARKKGALTLKPEGLHERP